MADLAAIRARHALYRRQHTTDFACCTAHATADDVPTLLAELDKSHRYAARLWAQLTAARTQITKLKQAVADTDTTGDTDGHADP